MHKIKTNSKQENKYLQQLYQRVLMFLLCKEFIQTTNKRNNCTTVYLIVQQIFIMHLLCAQFRKRKIPQNDMNRSLPSHSDLLNAN